MKRILFSGGLLAGDFVAQVTEFLWRSQREVGVGVAVVGLLTSLLKFSNDVFAGLTEHGETFSV